jgi:hypothetical protein
VVRRALLLGLVSGDVAGLATLVIVRCSSALALLLAAAVAQRR